jgi:hypothetical protein
LDLGPKRAGQRPPKMQRRPAGKNSVGLTFELTGPRRRTPAGRGGTISTMAWSGQTVAAVAGPVVERGVSRHSAAASGRPQHERPVCHLG